jgi:imidazolonepropionase-like amidohydrolase
MEAYDAIPENAGILHKAGACVVIHSDDENGIQRLNQEAAKAQGDAKRMGLSHFGCEAIRWLTSTRPRRSGSTS